MAIVPGLLGQKMKVIQSFGMLVTSHIIKQQAYPRRLDSSETLA
jgi:hypothetical protein